MNSRLKTNSRKKVKASVNKKKSGRARKDSASKEVMPVDTFDAWISKQVKASNRGASEKIVEHVESTKLPESTFDSWMKKQKPKESSASRPSSVGSPDTFDAWISKRVAEWKETPVEEKVVVAAGSSTVSE
jgi:hypothetical protein